MDNPFDQVAKTWDQDPMRVERSRITAEYFKRISLHDYKSLLDFGGGTGLLSLYLHDRFDQITIADTSKEMLGVARDKIREAKISNIKTIELNNDISEISDQYSAVITLMALHHIMDVDRFIQNAFKVIVDHGALIIADLYEEDGSFHKDVEDYNGHNGFNIEQLTKKIEDSGFKVIQAEKYFEIKKENYSGKEQNYPLFFLAAEKQGLKS